MQDAYTAARTAAAPKSPREAKEKTPTQFGWKNITYQTAHSSSSSGRMACTI